MGDSSTSLPVAGLGVDVLSASDIGNDVDIGVNGAGIVVVADTGSCCWSIATSLDIEAAYVVEAASPRFVSIRLVTEAEAPRVPPCIDGATDEGWWMN